MEPMSEAQRAIFDALPEVQKCAASERKWRSMIEATRKVEARRQEIESFRKTVAHEAEAFRVHHPIRTWLHDKGLVPVGFLTHAKTFVEGTAFEMLGKLGVSWASSEVCERSAEQCTQELDRMAVDPLVRAAVEKIQARNDVMDKQAERFLRRGALTASAEGRPAQENVVVEMGPRAVDRLREVTTILELAQAWESDPRLSEIAALLELADDGGAHQAPGM